MKSIKIMAAAIALCGMTACGDNTPKTFTGFITDASMNTVTVENAEGTFTFSTMDADKSEANGLLLGAPVVVDYKGKLEDGAAAAKVAPDPTYAEAVGKWTMPDPIDPEGVMGIEILIEGQAQSINMATLRYTSWELQGEAGKILLKGQSIGNGQTIDFTETATIAKDADREQRRRLHQSQRIAAAPCGHTRLPQSRRARFIYRRAAPQTVPGNGLSK